MPTVPVNDAGAVCFYEDSGVPHGFDNYLTIVALHGSSFHSGMSFQSDLTSYC